MKATGMIRQLDPLGRVVLPIELRRTLDIQPKDLLEIFVEGNSVILRKHEAACQFCGATHALVSFKDQLICDLSLFISRGQPSPGVFLS